MRLKWKNAVEKWGDIENIDIFMCEWVFRKDVCIVVELTDRPTIRVMSRLYRERTKTWLRTNQGALSNRSDWF